MTYIYIFLYKIIGCWENFLAGYLPQTLFPHTHTGIKCKIDLMEIGCRDKSPRGKDIFPLASSYKYMNNGGMGCQKAAMCPTYVSLKGCRGVWLAIVSLANSPVTIPWNISGMRHIGPTELGPHSPQSVRPALLLELHLHLLGQRLCHPRTAEQR